MKFQAGIALERFEEEATEVQKVEAEFDTLALSGVNAPMPSIEATVEPSTTIGPYFRGILLEKPIRNPKRSRTFWVCLGLQLILVAIALQLSFMGHGIPFGLMRGAKGPDPLSILVVILFIGQYVLAYISIKDSKKNAQSASLEQLKKDGPSLTQMYESMPKPTESSSEDRQTRQ